MFIMTSLYLVTRKLKKNNKNKLLNRGVFDGAVLVKNGGDDDAYARHCPGPQKDGALDVSQKKPQKKKQQNKTLKLKKKFFSEMPQSVAADVDLKNAK